MAALGSTLPDTGTLDSQVKFRVDRTGARGNAALRGDVGKAPVKALRNFFSLGTGCADPIGGVVSRAADAFLLDRFLKGWRPNHFVDGRLKPFLKGES